MWKPVWSGTRQLLDRLVPLITTEGLESEGVKGCVEREKFSKKLNRELR